MTDTVHQSGTQAASLETFTLTVRPPTKASTTGICLSRPNRGKTESTDVGWMARNLLAVSKLYWTNVLLFFSDFFHLSLL